MKKLKVVFCGTPDFSVPTLDMLYQHPLVEVVKVISMPSRPRGRGMELQDPEVITYAKKVKLPFFQCENINREQEFIEELEKSSVDLIIVLAFAQFLGSKVLNLPKIGSFNIHTSILPKFRGAAPIQHALLAGDSDTGVSIQRMVKKMDAGDLVLSKVVPITDNETGGSLYTKLKYQAALSSSDFIDRAFSQDLNYSAQDEEQVTFAPTLSRNDGKLDFTTSTVTQIDRKVRALFPWPGTFTFLNGKRLKVFNIEKVSAKAKPGHINSDMNTLVVGCQDGAIRLKYVQIEGKKASDDQTLINGLRNKIKEFKIEESSK